MSRQPRSYLGTRTEPSIPLGCAAPQFLHGRAHFGDATPWDGLGTLGMWVPLGVGGTEGPSASTQTETQAKAGPRQAAARSPPALTPPPAFHPRWH